MKIITLLTDFGNSDGYSGVLHGVIKSININTEIIDISHNVKPQSILSGSYILYSTYKYFPQNTIHTIIIDPTVGSNRKALIIKTENYFFICPDNGIISLVANVENILNVYKIKIKKNVSNTFHGRDIFCPTAAKLSLNKNILDFSEEIDKNKIILLNLIHKFNKPQIENFKILNIDKFGNIITNIQNKDFEKIEYIKLNNKIINTKVKYYAQIKNNSFAMLKGSSDFVEIAQNNALN